MPNLRRAICSGLGGADVALMCFKLIIIVDKIRDHRSICKGNNIQVVFDNLKKCPRLQIR